MAYKTLYVPTNKSKYVGDIDNILCRSLWERRFCKYLDENTNVLKWGFEIIKIPYLSSVDNKIHSYIPDFVVESKTKESKTKETKKEISIIEIKPAKQTIEPIKRKNKKSSLQECITYSINTSKWKSATEYCNRRGWTFRIITEKDLF